MPTGYTSDLYDIKKKVSFREFTLGCARAFGALITMRDDARDAVIPDEFKPSEYHTDALKKAEKDLSVVEKWTVPDAAIEAGKDYKKSCKNWDKAKEESDARRARYEEMIAHARAWDPPTAEHRPLKDFMIEQLETSIKHDCSMYEKPSLKGALTYRLERLKSAKWAVDYHKEELKKEIDRCKERTAWVQALKKSL